LSGTLIVGLKGYRLGSSQPPRSPRSPRQIQRFLPRCSRCARWWTSTWYLTPQDGPTQTGTRKNRCFGAFVTSW